MPQLFLRFLTPVQITEDGPSVELEWLVLDDDGSVKTQGEADARGLSEIVDPGADWVDDPDNVIVLIPGENVLAVQCQVPGRSMSQIRRALPFAVEEFLTQDVEDMHIAHGPIKRGAPIDCLILPNELMRGWIELLTSVGLSPGYFVSDTALLPSSDSEVSVLLDHEHALVKTPSQMATLDRPNLIDVLDLISAGFEPDQRPVLHLINGTMSDLEISQSGFARDQIEHVAAPHGVVAYLADRFREDRPINLMQGEFSPARRRSGSGARWRPIIGLAAAWAVISVIVFLVEGMWSESRAEALRADSNELYKSIYDVRRVPGDPARRMRENLGQSDESAIGFEELIGQLALGIKDSVPSSTLSSITYTENRGELAIDFMVASFDLLDTLKNALERRGLRVDISSAEQQGDAVRAYIRIVGE